MISLEGRWSWPVLLGAIALAAGVASGWSLLARTGMALPAVRLIATVVTALSISAEGVPASRAVTAGELPRVNYRMGNRGFWRA